MKKVLFATGAVLVISGFAGEAKANVVTYTGADNVVSSLAQMTNSVAAETSWAAAVPGANVITFEVALPVGVGVSGGSITNNSVCGARCGFNTTPGGAFFYLLSGSGGTATFTFTTPINAFGMYITGLQTDLVPQETLTFSDGASQTINTPASTGGGSAFLGFTDFGKSIVSVSYNATNDIVSLDDVRYSSAVPEPSYFIPLALLGVFAWTRRRGIRVS